MSPPLAFSSPLIELKGIGPANAAVLAAGGLLTVGDLLSSLPFRYEDRSGVRTIASLESGSGVVTVHGTITHVTERRARNRRLRLTQAVVDDGGGAIAVVWFNQPYLAASLEVGRRIWLHGAVRPGRSWGLELSSPEWEIEDEDSDPVHLGRIVPIYRRVGSFSGRRLRSLVARALAGLGDPEDTLGRWLPPGLHLPSLLNALRATHFPPPAVSEADNAALLSQLGRGATPAQRRLAFDELLGLATVLAREREQRRHQHARACVVTDAVRDLARSVLPFRLTGAQRRVLAEIVADLQRSFPMARLLQGDVGSGKTIVATIAALVALESGSQVALLAPTELLAQQHHATLSRLLARTPYAPSLLIGSLPAREKERRRERLAGGEDRLVVGTHALITDEVVFSRLSFAIIDEQHRFGVSQRERLLAKGDAPHLLVMTATPIPRSLALSLYGDLDVSLLDELPPGRTPVRTVARAETARPRLLEFVRREVLAGGQAYWVFPLIEESERVSARAVESHASAVREGLPGVEVGVVHGRTRAGEREAIMAAFTAGELGVLCATTVIEVGVDVPNASVMVIENAERFGLAQLHQLRGRVGRGRRRSLCVLLVGESCTGEAARRIETFAATSDGFKIAEEDFRQRGPGELTGVRQWGRGELRVASLTRHLRELEEARAVADAAAARGELASLEQALGPNALAGRSVATG